MLACACHWQPAPAAADDLPDVFSQDVSRFERLTRASPPALRLEGVQGFAWLGHHAGEAPLLPLLSDPDGDVRFEATRGLTRCGRRRGIEALVASLPTADYHAQRIGHEGMRDMTGQDFDRPQQWPAWLHDSDWPAKQAKLLEALSSEDSGVRCRALRALRHVGDGTAEEPLLQWLAAGKGVGREETRLAILVLERVGSVKSIPYLTKMATRYREIAWALGEIAGPGAEAPLIAGLRRFGSRELGYMTNLDRLHSTKCEPFIPALLRTFGLVIFRSQTDELHMPATARQRVAANLILRTGKAPQVVDLILAECEGTRRDADTPEPLRALLKGMQHELKPGFVRSDGLTVTQPLAALPHITKSKEAVPRLIKLLKHRAYIVRIYAATTLGALHAEEAIDPILEVVLEPYGFNDAVELASAKHFRKSWSVRWRGFLCMALGRLGGEKARQALEELATDPNNFRDIRYGAVVGLGSLGSPSAIPALQQVAREDIIWMIRTSARETIDDIRLRREDDGAER